MPSGRSLVVIFALAAQARGLIPHGCWFLPSFSYQQHLHCILQVQATLPPDRLRSLMESTSGHYKAGIHFSKMLVLVKAKCRDVT